MNYDSTQDRMDDATAADVRVAVSLKTKELPKLKAALLEKLVKLADRFVNVFSGQEVDVRVEEDEEQEHVHLVFAWPRGVAQHGNVISSTDLVALETETRKLIPGLCALWVGFNTTEFLVWGVVKQSEGSDSGR